MIGRGKFQLHIRKEALKFSAAHMTVFSDGTKESLHGHNYAVEVGIDLIADPDKFTIPFHAIKARMRGICEFWDEKVLLAELSPFLEIKNRSEQEVEFLLCQKRYVLPREEVVFLKVGNITSESLAREFCERLISVLEPNWFQHAIDGIRVKIEETSGQGASFSWYAN